MADNPLEIRIGRKHGLPWAGLNERVVDGAQQPNEAVAGYNWRVNRGVLETRPGITHAFEGSRPTNYYAVGDATAKCRFPSGDHMAVVNQMPRWTWVISFRTPASFAATGWLLHRGVTISATQYEQGISIDSSGIVSVALVDSAGGDKTFTSGVNALGPSTEYVLQVSRYDANAYLFWGTKSDSADASSSYGTTALLGETDHPLPDSGSAHPVVIGSKYTLGTTTHSDYMAGTTFQIHEVTLLQYFVDHVDFGWTSFADPLDPRCALHCRFEDASGAFTDLSGHAGNSEAHTGWTYQQTTNSFIEESAVVCGVAEFTKASDEERIVTVIDGSIAAANYHV